jgi:hypothetical protein
VGGVVEGQGYVGVLRKLKEATQILHFWKGLVHRCWQKAVFLKQLWLIPVTNLTQTTRCYQREF